MVPSSILEPQVTLYPGVWAGTAHGRWIAVPDIEAFNAATSGDTRIVGLTA